MHDAHDFLLSKTFLLNKFYTGILYHSVTFLDKFVQLAPVFIYWAKRRRGYFQFLDFSPKFVIIPEPVMILTWNLDQ